VKNERTNPRAGFRFDEKNLPAGLTVTNDGTTANCTGGGWLNVRCAERMTPHHNYIEWKVLQGATSNLMLGIVKGNVSNSGYAGQYVNGWTYYSGGQIYHSGSTPATGQNYQQGDRIGCLYDFAAGKLTFYKNGKVSVTLVGNGLPTGTDAEDVFPTASFSGYTSVSIVQYAQDPEGKKKRKLKGLLDSSKKPTSFGTGSGTTTTGQDKTSLIRRFLKF